MAESWDLDEPSQGRTRGGRYASAAADAIPALCVGLTVFFAVQVVLHLLLLEGMVQTVLVTIAAASTTAAGVAAGLLWRRRPTAAVASPLAAGAVLLVAGHASLALALAGQPWRTGEVMLALVTAAWLLVPLRWLIPVEYVIWGTWLVAAATAQRPPAWAGALTGMVTASALAVGLRRARGRDLDELARANELVEAVSVRDPLTGLANQRGLFMLAEPIVETSRRAGDAVHAALVTIEGLDQLRADRGPVAADRLLVSVADAVAASIRATDVAAVWSRDVFAVVGPGPGVEPDRLTARVRERLVATRSYGEASASYEEVFPSQPSSPVISAVTLVASCAVLAPWDSGGLDTLLSMAERELAQVKALRRAGRGDLGSGADRAQRRAGGAGDSGAGDGGAGGGGAGGSE